MEEKLDICPKHLNIIKDICRQHLPSNVNVWVFGSRANMKAKEYSDLDLALEQKNGTPVSAKLRMSLASEFEESDLPWKVDVIDFNRVSLEFKKIIEKEKVKLERNKSN